MYENINFTIRGTASLLLQNGKAADPLNPINKLTKPISSKRGKTDEDHELLANLEWVKYFYPSEDGIIGIENGKVVLEGYGIPIIPGEIIESLLIEGAKKIRKGEHFKCAIISNGNWPILYKGAKTIKELFGDHNFRDMRMVSISGKRIPKCRPCFKEWSLNFNVEFLPELLNRQDVIDVLDIAGKRCGLCDYRPQHGRFVIESFS